MSVVLSLKLPSNTVENLPFSSVLKVDILKDTIESIYGIPYELQKVTYNGNILNNEKVLQEEGIKDGSELNIDVDDYWKAIIGSCLLGNTTAIVNEAEQIFVLSFISATKGNPSALVCLLNLYNDFDIKIATKVTGRTLLHAAVTSDSLKCVEEIKKLAGLQFEKLLYFKDKSGRSPLDCLSSGNTRMMNYINKFISNPIKIEDFEKKSTAIPKTIDKENTYVINETVEEEEIKTDDANETKNEKMDVHKETNVNNKGLEPSIKNTTIPDSNNNSPKLGRPKENVNNLSVTVESKITRSVSPLLIGKTENTKIVKVGKQIVEKNNNSLPVLNNNNNNNNNNEKKSQRKSSEIIMPKTFQRQPRPPTQENKRKPVAGLLMESSARKYSAARRTRVASDGSVPLKSKQVIAPRRAASAEPNLPISSGQGQVRSESAGKVRRISLIQNPQVKRPSSNDVNLENVELPETNIIEIDKERIDKPWNSWIKAVTVDADSVDAKNIPNTADQKTRKSSLQVNNGGKSRKKSFDQWVLSKTQEQMAELQKLYNTNKHENEAEGKWSQGKSYEKWKQEKEEHERLVKDQKQAEKENEVPGKVMKGKKFEQWQKETEEREKAEADATRLRLNNEKASQEEKQQKRRKESVAKYNAWLQQKDKEALEKENGETLKVARRKTSSVKVFNQDDEENGTRKIIKGKTYEDWQKEREERINRETEERKLMEAQDKANKDEEEKRRRKESVAKYQAWLAQKDREAIEKEIKSKFNPLAKRKTSYSVKVTNDLKSRKKSEV